MKCSKTIVSITFCNKRKDVRVVEGADLERLCNEGCRGFESLSFRQMFPILPFLKFRFKKNNLCFLKILFIKH